MFCYIYADFWGLYRPGNLQDILDGQGPIGPTSQATLVAVSMLVATPALMIFSSLVLPPKLNRWTNIILGIALAAIEIMTLPGARHFHMVMTAIELALQITIIYYAWHWPARVPAEHAIASSARQCTQSKMQ